MDGGCGPSIRRYTLRCGGAAGETSDERIRRKRFSEKRQRGDSGDASDGLSEALAGVACMIASRSARDATATKLRRRCTWAPLACCVLHGAGGTMCAARVHVAHCVPHGFCARRAAWDGACRGWR